MKPYDHLGNGAENACDNLTAKLAPRVDISMPGHSQLDQVGMSLRFCFESKQCSGNSDNFNDLLKKLL